MLRSSRDSGNEFVWWTGVLLTLMGEARLGHRVAYRFASRLKLLAEAGYGVSHGPSGGIGQGAYRTSFHLRRQIEQKIEIAGIGVSIDHAVQDFL